MSQTLVERVNFLFWNLKGGSQDSLCACLTELVVLHDIQILIVAEATLTLRQRFLQHCQGQGLGYSELETLQPQVKTHIFSRYPPASFRDLAGSDRMRVLAVKIGDLEEILLFSLHLWDARNSSLEDRGFRSMQIAQQIKAQQNLAGHSRSIVVGDFNMNPFDPPMISPAGFHAVMDRAISQRRTSAQRNGRIIDDETYPYLYNPTWHLMGNQVSRVPGSYYFSQPKVTHYWYTLDQVLVGPDLVSRFSIDSLELLTQVNDHHLLTPQAGKPNAKLYSDHLPLKFSLLL